MPVSFDPVAFGKRLSAARDNARLTQEEVAHALGVPRTAVALMEAGNRSVSSDEIIKIAGLYGRSVQYFFQAASGPAEEDPLVVLGRIAPELEEDPRATQAIRGVVEICAAGMQLGASLGQERRDGPPAYEVPPPRNAGEAVEQGERCAEQERKRIGLGDAPIADIHELIACQRVWAASEHLPDGISGLFVNHSAVGMVAVVNHAHNRWRQRFSYAHEYAHALFDRDLKVTYTGKDNAKNLIESRANAFAAAFLMPARAVQIVLDKLGKGRPSKQVYQVYDVATDESVEAERRAIPGSQHITVKEVAHLALAFDVSYQAACYRLRSLGYINQREVEELLRLTDFGRLYLSLSTGDPDPEREREQNRAQDRHLVAQLLPLIVEAFQRELISRGRILQLSKLMGVSGPDVLEVAQPR